LAFSSYGAFWISYYVLVKAVIPGIKPPTDVAVAVGVFLLGWTIFTFYMIFASLKVNGAVVVVFVLLTITFVFLTIGAFHSSVSMNKIGGWFGIATAAAAWYASFGGVMNDTFKKAVIPLLPLAPGSRPTSPK
jgi:succinate-acetate transporter protein